MIYGQVYGIAPECMCEKVNFMWKKECIRTDRPASTPSLNSEINVTIEQFPSWSQDIFGLLYVHVWQCM